MQRVRDLFNLPCVRAESREIVAAPSGTTLAVPALRGVRRVGGRLSDNQVGEAVTRREKRGNAD